MTRRLKVDEAPIGRGEQSRATGPICRIGDRQKRSLMTSASTGLIAIAGHRHSLAPTPPRCIRPSQRRQIVTVITHSRRIFLFPSSNNHFPVDRDAVTQRLMSEPEKPQEPERPRKSRKAIRGKPRGIHTIRKNDKQPFKYDPRPVIAAHEATRGRPTDYTPLRGAEILAHMASGLSITAAAAAMGFARDTIYEWARRYKEFADALNRARGARLLYWERKLCASVDGPAVAAAIFGLKNADPTEWKDKHVVAPEPADTDPLLAYLKSIDGNVLRPREPVTIHGTCEDVTNVTMPAQIDGPPRPISPEAS